MRFYSIIVPVFNRPDEIQELLESLCAQTYNNFEVIIIEDGSSIDCEKICQTFKNRLNLKYFFKPNEGRSIARNFGLAKALGEYLIIFDSDCIIPETYFSVVENYLNKQRLDYFGGPDADHPSFSPVQKAISYAMTSMLSTGGIRGKSEKLTKFYPRSFNLGMHESVFKATKGFPDIPLAEDIDLSLNVEKLGFKIGRITDAFVYHKRRSNFKQFYKQVNRFGIGRIDLSILHPGTLKLTHFFPSAFIFFCLISLLCSFFIGIWAMIPIIIYFMAIIIDAYIRFKNFKMSVLSLLAVLVQMAGYGLGFAKAFIKRILFKQNSFAKY